MAPDISRRRWVGGIALLLAAAMLVCGETVLKGELTPVAFLLYWFVCMFLTGLAIVTAIGDMRVQRERARAESRELLESTLKEIQDKAQAKSRSPSSTGQLAEGKEGAGGSSHPSARVPVPKNQRS